MAKKIEYSAVKKGLWEAWRTFVPAFVGVVAVQLEAGVDLYTWKNWVPALVGSAAVAGLRAIVKWARETYFKGEYGSAIYKLPL